jgi:hypothetical protein
VTPTAAEREIAEKMREGVQLENARRKGKGLAGSLGEAQREHDHEQANSPTSFFCFMKKSSVSAANAPPNRTSSGTKYFKGFLTAFIHVYETFIALSKPSSVGIM